MVKPRCNFADHKRMNAVALLICMITAIALGAWQFDQIEVSSRTGRATDCGAADFDGDGNIDLFCARIGDGSRWYKNNGGARPQFEESQPIVSGGHWMGAWHGDFDGDGDIDYVASNNADNLTAWFENKNSDGSAWIMHEIWKAGDRADNCRSFDFNDDGRDDVVGNLYNGSSVKLAIAPARADGSWKVYDIGKGPTGLNLFDIDTDGDMDVLANNAWLENPGNPAQSSWPAHSIDANYRGTKVAAGDLDGDKKPDVVLAGEPGGKGIYWYKAPANPKSDEWQPREIQKSYIGVHSLQLVDFDIDGDLDILAAEMHSTGQHRVAIFENGDGKGGQWNEHILTTAGTHNAIPADVNGDGLVDIVGKNYSGDSELYVWYNTLHADVDVGGNSIQRAASCLHVMSKQVPDGNFYSVAGCRIPHSRFSVRRFAHGLYVSRFSRALVHFTDLNNGLW